MRFNQRELELVSVTRDLFLKGSPEFCVAKYARERGFTQQQLQNFLSKVCVLPSPVVTRIVNHFRDMELNSCFDDSLSLGKDLDGWLKSQKQKKSSDA